jgi:hypothetical protein
LEGRERALDAAQHFGATRLAPAVGVHTDPLDDLAPSGDQLDQEPVTCSAKRALSPSRPGQADSSLRRGKLLIRRGRTPAPSRLHAS